MIHVDRSSVPKPQVLDGVYKSGAWKGKTERDKAINHFNTHGIMTGFKYQRYGKPEVKEALSELFHQKCAYCESKYKAVHPVDVEHFRPKKIVLVRAANGDLNERFGYYWLGSAWTNLLPSCIDCNRRRYHMNEDGIPILGGKKNLFPLESEVSRAIEPGDEVNEEEHRLLLNPCQDQPEEHLFFSDEGVVTAAILDTGEHSKKGEESIRVYGLWRPDLVQARKAVCIKIMDCIDQIETDEHELELVNYLLIQNPGIDQLIELKVSIENGISFHKTELKNFQHESAEYSAMAKQIIN